MVPWSLACANIPKMGTSTAEIQNPKVTQTHKLPDLKPSWGGRIKFPAPKKREKRAKAVTAVAFLFTTVDNYLAI